MPEEVTAVNVATGEDVVVEEVPTADEAQVVALRRERAGYVQRGLADRVSAVDVELKRLGAGEARTEAAPRETAVESKPRATAGRAKRGE